MLFTAIVGVGMIRSVPEMLQTASASPISTAANVALLAIQLLALALLYSPPGREWFRRSA